MKDINIIKSVNKLIAARSVIDFMHKHYPKEIRPADTKWNGKFQEIQPPPPGSNLGLIIDLYKGKAHGYYVDKYIAESFENNPIESSVIA
ncbi:MAG: hypothetical protein GWN76_00900, partial [candidate division Zixibacteria bacterium]|nr:hypothetical protein [candidate division Zixibacteria bacterium]NIX54506.1 hypothetical protein [candidate division Zixibacteria bacterium]